MKEPKILLTRLEKIFQVCCFFLAVYWITYFSSQYAENRDTTFISMKTFNARPEDKYPAFTICFKGSNFHWLREENIFDSFGINSVQLEAMLKKGKAFRDELKKESKVYEKKTVVYRDGINVSLEQYHLKLTDFLYELEYITEDVTESVKFINGINNSINADQLINVSYHSADKICFSRSLEDKPKSIRLRDLVTFNSSVLEKYPDTEIHVFLHHPNHLIRSLDKPKYKSTFAYLISKLGQDKGNGPSILEFRISQVKQLRKRDTSATPCRDDIPNIDEFYQENVLKVLGCIPPYWISTVSNQHKLTKCTSPEKLKYAFKQIESLETIGDWEEKPCNEMLLLSIEYFNKEPSPKPKDIAIEFVYAEKTYEEIQYNKMMGFDGWLSNVGGFVGIFLGYSMLQVPEILACIIGFFQGEKLKNLRSKTDKISYNNLSIK